MEYQRRSTMRRVADCLLALFGQRRILLGAWPDQAVVDAAVSTFEEFGAEKLATTPVDLPVDIENVYFRVQGRRVRLWIEEYGDVTLWGPSAIVTRLATRIAERQAWPRPA